MSLCKFSSPIIRHCKFTGYSNMQNLLISTKSSIEGCGTEKFQTMVKTLREKTPLGKLEELDEGKHPYQEKEPLLPFPGGVNPETGEIGGPLGPEPTRYGDWERKGRVTDF